MANTHQVKVMVPTLLLSEMDETIESGRFSSRGDLALYAIRYYLDKIREEERSRASAGADNGR